MHAPNRNESVADGMGQCLVGRGGGRDLASRRRIVAPSQVSGRGQEGRGGARTFSPDSLGICANTLSELEGIERRLSGELHATQAGTNRTTD